MPQYLKYLAAVPSQYLFQIADWH